MYCMFLIIIFFFSVSSFTRSLNSRLFNKKSLIRPSIIYATNINRLDISSESEIVKILDICDINKNKFFEDVKNEKTKDELKKLTDIAFKNDIFGAPTFVVNKKIFWGQDRLDYALDEYKS